MLEKLCEVVRVEDVLHPPIDTVTVTVSCSVTTVGDVTPWQAQVDGSGDVVVAALIISKRSAASILLASFCLARYCLCGRATAADASNARMQACLIKPILVTAEMAPVTGLVFSVSSGSVRDRMG